MVGPSSGKRSAQPEVNNVNASAGQESYLLHVVDKLKNQKWLVDGGAVVSIVPPTYSPKLRGPNGTGLKAANGSLIQCYGTTTQTI